MCTMHVEFYGVRRDRTYDRRPDLDVMMFDYFLLSDISDLQI
jgi:hypothetical protein